MNGINFFQIKDQLESAIIRNIAHYLYMQRVPITYFGKAWSQSTNNWIYFDSILDLEMLISRFDSSRRLMIHENRDPKSGMERGLIDPETGEAIMGKL